MEMTQLSLQYKKSPIIDYAGNRSKLMASGMRALDVNIDSSMHLYDFLRNTKHNILIFTGLRTKPKRWTWAMKSIFIRGNAALSNGLRK